ncbi:MAG: hypothetical protein ABIQ18_21930 [Umezawaea sp.]
MLFVICGSSCSGKTTAARACTDVDGMVVHDFDEIGVPSTADLVWRQRGLEGWIHRALDYQDNGLDMLLLGQSPLGEVLACPSATRLDGIAACLLDVEDRQRWQRLERRDPGKWDRDAKRSFIGWARWHRAHAADPQAAPGVITAGAWERMVWSRWNNWDSDDSRWSVAVVDTTDRTVAQTSYDIGRWIACARSGVGAGRRVLTGDWAST